MENEVWKIMKEHSNYEVSNLGKIKRQVEKAKNLLCS